MPLSPSGAPEPDDLHAALTGAPFAHRGLHGSGIPENSRAAFRAAIEAGHGIELDVQASRESDAFVFHDYDLDRLTEQTGPVAAREAAALERVKLRGIDETIPPLAEVLQLIGSRVPLLIEVKIEDRRVAPLCRSVACALAGYRGTVGVMSFNPNVGRWLASHAPNVTRGLVVTEENKRGVRGQLERRLALWRSRAQFFAYDVRDLPSPFAAAAQRRGLPVLTWTVRTDEQRRTAAAHADQIIYETR